MNSGPVQEAMAESFADSQSQLTFAESEKRDLATGVPAPSLADSQLDAALSRHCQGGSVDADLEGLTDGEA